MITTDIPFICPGEEPGCCDICHHMAKGSDEMTFVMPDGQKIRLCCKTAYQFTVNHPGIRFLENNV